NSHRPRGARGRCELPNSRPTATIRSKTECRRKNEECRNCLRRLVIALAYFFILHSCFDIPLQARPPVIRAATPGSFNLRPMRTQLRIVAGSLKGRKLACTVAPDLRPMPDRVRESLFNILSEVVVDRPFFDLFAGTGAVGFE